jgi:hypothetical protein
VDKVVLQSLDRIDLAVKVFANKLITKSIK